MTTTYDLSGLVQIVLSDDLHRNVKESVANQIVGLKPVGSTDSDYTLELRPYDALDRENSRMVGGPARLVGTNTIEVPDIHFAVRIEQKRITLFLDVSGVAINPWIQLLLVPQGVTMVHAAGLEKDGRALLLPAFGGAGKTLAAGVLVRDYGYKFLGDDIVLVKSDGTILPFPRPLFFYPHHIDVFDRYFGNRAGSVSRQRLSKAIKRNIVRRMPLKQLVKSFAESFGIEGVLRRAASSHDHLDSAAPAEVFKPEAIGTGSPVSKIVFLQRHTGHELTISEIKPDLLATRMFAILMNEWKSEWPQIISAGGYGAINLATHYEQFARVIKSGIRSISPKILMIPTETSPLDYVAKLLEE